MPSGARRHYLPAVPFPLPRSPSELLGLALPARDVLDPARHLPDGLELTEHEPPHERSLTLDLDLHGVHGDLAVQEHADERAIVDAVDGDRRQRVVETDAQVPATLVANTGDFASLP